MMDETLEVEAVKSEAQQRFESLDQAALDQKMERLRDAVDEAAIGHALAMGHRVPSVKARIMWLRQASETFDKGVRKAGVAACRRGCRACCSTPVSVTRQEAEDIAQATGRALSRNPQRAIVVSDALPPEQMTEALQLAKSEVHRHIGKACPFLKNGECAIYAHRPLACRYHYNMDDDDLLCRLEEDAEGTQVPYLNSYSMLLPSILALMPTTISDIRDWFPTRVGS